MAAYAAFFYLPKLIFIKIGSAKYVAYNMHIIYT
jgi:hypothetical protein